MLKFFRKKWTQDKLITAVSAILGPGSKAIKVSNRALAVSTGNDILVIAELTKDRRGAVLAFSSELEPAYAAEIALLFQEILPTFVDLDFRFMKSVSSLRETKIPQEVH